MCFTHGSQMMMESEDPLQNKPTMSIRIFYWINFISCVFFDATLQVIAFLYAIKISIAMAVSL